MAKRKRQYRDRKTGRFVTRKYAKKHPKRAVKLPRQAGNSEPTSPASAADALSAS